MKAFKESGVEVYVLLLRYLSEMEVAVGNHVQPLILIECLRYSWRCLLECLEVNPCIFFIDPVFMYYLFA